MSRENAVISYLEENGPAPKDELPRQPGRSDKRRGLASFKPFHHGYTGVAYLFESHSPGAVVETYIEANPAVLDEKSTQELIPAVADYGSDWQTAITDVLDEQGQLEAPWEAAGDDVQAATEAADTQTESEAVDTQPDTEEIEPPTGPFVWYGRQIGKAVAPRQGLAAYAQIAARIFLPHFLLGLVAAMAGQPTVAGGLVLLGILAALRYGRNVAARHHKMIQRLAEEYPDAEVRMI